MSSVEGKRLKSSGAEGEDCIQWLPSLMCFKCDLRGDTKVDMFASFHTHRFYTDLNSSCYTNIN